MIRSFLPRELRPRCTRPALKSAFAAGSSNKLARLAAQCAAGAALVAFFAASGAAAQVLTIDTSGKVSTANGPVDRRFQQIQPTHVDLSKVELNTRTRYELIRVMQAEQGFAMRPFPRGHKGLTLVANGKLEPAGEAYLDMAVAEGICANPGDRVILTDVKFDHNKMIFELNGGPDLKHRILRHIEVGGGLGTSPVVQDDGQPATGARLTLEFKGHVPDMTGAQVKALLAPLISFDVKTPIQAYTDTLPTPLKNAILSHQVLVGMNTDMVLFAKGQPLNKIREMDGQMPFEEWIYGKPPDPVEFVRVNGNRVIRVEIAKIGEPIQVFTTDVVEGMMRSDGTPVIAQDANVHIIREGDVERDPNKEAPAPPPSLIKPGEKTDEDPNLKNTGQMRPVQPPKPNPDYEPPGTNPDVQQPAAPPPASSQPATPAQPANSSQPAPAPSSTQPSSPSTGAN